jgi:formate dehydrogenase subunit gamma
MSAPPRLGEAQHSGTPPGRPRDLIVRYNASERTNHWLGAIAFILVAISGLALFHPALFFLSNLLGGGPWTRILHPYLGLVMGVSFVFLAARVARDNRMQPRDWQWLRQYRDVIENREERLPEVGRYNAGQKLVFYSVVLCLGVLLVTGIAIWRVYTAGYFPVGVVRLGSVLHAIAALVLICTIIVHVYAAIWVKGSVEAMTRGTVTPGWAWKHHRAWFREIIRHAANPRSGAD